MISITNKKRLYISTAFFISIKLISIGKIKSPIIVFPTNLKFIINCTHNLSGCNWVHTVIFMHGIIENITDI